VDTKTQTEAVRILLADENPIFATGCALTLARYGIEVIGEVKAPANILTCYDSLRPEVVVIDVALGGKHNGLEAAKALLLARTDARIVMLGQDGQAAAYREVYRIGACAFVSKDRDPADLAQAIMRARAGMLFFMPHVAEELASAKVRGDDCPHELLDGREFEVFKLIALGRTNVEMADLLRVSLKTISNYSMTIKKKLRTERIAELTRIAVRYGVIEP
jgi:DNA-binding NarL/FixJ family response regulator